MRAFIKSLTESTEEEEEEEEKGITNSLNAFVEPPLPSNWLHYSDDEEECKNKHASFVEVMPQPIVTFVPVIDFYS